MTFYFTQVGLVCDILGVLILFKYGLPSEYNEQPDIFTLASPADKNEVNETKRKNKLIKRMAYLGLTFLLLGFIGQFIGSSNNN